VRRRRDIPADPARTSAETAEAIADLIAAAVPAADRAELAGAANALRPFLGYLIPGEHLTREPLTLVADKLACDIFTLHGEDAVGAEDPDTPPGAASATSWVLYVPVPDGAPFTDREIEAADHHLHAGAAPDDAGRTEAKATPSAAELLGRLALRGNGT
jgi:hypothetical protein